MTAALLSWLAFCGALVLARLVATRNRKGESVIRDADLIAYTDAATTCRLYRMALHSRALHHQDRDRDMAQLLADGAEVAGALAEEYAGEALFMWANRDARTV